MAKKPKADSEAAKTLKAVLPKDVQVFDVPGGAEVTVDVDVADMAIPYTIALDAAVVIKAEVDRKETLSPLAAGVHRLSWGFAHTVKGWSHKVTLDIDGTATVLEQRSEAKKDKDHSIGVAFLVVA